MRKKRHFSCLLPLCAVALLGGAAAFFSAGHRAQERTAAGTADLVLNDLSDLAGNYRAFSEDGGRMRSFSDGLQEEAVEKERAYERSGIINPGDLGLLQWQVKNRGEKSMDLAALVRVESAVPMTTGREEYVLTGLGEAERIPDENGKTAALVYCVPLGILDGSVETEAGSLGREAVFACGTDFSRDAGNAFSGMGFVVRTRIFAKQHRNTFGSIGVSDGKVFLSGDWRGIESFEQVIGENAPRPFSVQRLTASEEGEFLDAPYADGELYDLPEATNMMLLLSGEGLVREDVRIERTFVSPDGQETALDPSAVFHGYGDGRVRALLRLDDLPASLQGAGTLVLRISWSPGLGTGRVTGRTQSFLLRLVRKEQASEETPGETAVAEEHGDLQSGDREALASAIYAAAGRKSRLRSVVFGAALPEDLSEATVVADHGKPVYVWPADTGIVHVGTDGTLTLSGNCLEGVCRDLTKLTSIRFLDCSADEVTGIAGLARNCRGLTEIDLSVFDGEMLSDCKDALRGCTGLKTVHLGGMRLKGLDDASGMFAGCSSLAVITAAEGGPVAAEISAEMFAGCSSLYGGEGTAFDEALTDGRMAGIDRSGEPGYLTYVRADGDNG